MPEVRDLFNSGDLAFIANTGTLVEPMTVAQYNAGGPAPRSLFSHSDQQSQWATSVPQSTIQNGWFGRAADTLESLHNPASSLSMNFTLGGSTLQQTGAAGATAYTISDTGAVELWADGSAGGLGLFSQGMRATAASPKINLLEQVIGQEGESAYDNAGIFNSAFQSSSLATTFPTSDLGNNLKAVARTIKAHGSFGMNRQTFLVREAGFDMHGELLQAHALSMQGLSQAVGAFWDALGEMNLRDEVVLFVCSEFGRTLRSNGGGTDHAWGGNVFALGGGVNGKNIYGQYPTALTLGSGLDVGSNGRILPTTSCDEYFCDLLRWFGVGAGDMASVLPNIGNFYNPYSTTPPLGLMV